MSDQEFSREIERTKMLHTSKEERRESRKQKKNVKKINEEKKLKNKVFEEKIGDKLINEDENEEETKDGKSIIGRETIIKDGRKFKQKPHSSRGEDETSNISEEDESKIDADECLIIEQNVVEKTKKNEEKENSLDPKIKSLPVNKDTDINIQIVTVDLFKDLPGSLGYVEEDKQETNKEDESKQNNEKGKEICDKSNERKTEDKKEVSESNHDKNNLDTELKDKTKDNKEKMKDSKEQSNRGIEELEIKDKNEKNPPPEIVTNEQVAQKPGLKIHGLSTGALRVLGGGGLKGSSLPFLLSMPAGGGGGLSLLPAGLPPGRYVILPSTTSSIPSVSSITATTSQLGTTKAVVANITQTSRLSSQTCTTMAAAAAAVASVSPVPVPSAICTLPSVSTGRLVRSGRGGFCGGGRSVRGRRKSYTAAEKLAMIEAVESGQKKSTVADLFGVAPSTLACILLQKNKIRSDQDLSRRRLRQSRHLPIACSPVSRNSFADSDGGSPFTHFLTPLSPPRPTVFDQSPEEIVSMPDLSDRMGMSDGNSTTKMEGASNFLTCSPLIPGMTSMHEDILTSAGPSLSQETIMGTECSQSEYEVDDDMDVKAEPVFTMAEIEDENSPNDTQSSSDRPSSQSSPTPGMAGPYLLKKETHCTTILDQLLRDDTFTDVTLTAEGHSIRAHRIVLCLASAYFKQVLSKDSNVQNVIVFRDVKFNELKNLINFIYTGEATVDAAELESFMKTAEMLEISSLCDGQRNLPKSFYANKSREEPERSKPSSSSKRTSSSSHSPPSKSRKTSESSKASKHISQPSTSTTTVIKSEPIGDDGISEDDGYRENLKDIYESHEGRSSPSGYREDIDKSPGYSSSPDPGISDPKTQSIDKISPGRCPFCPNSQQLRKGAAMTKHLYISHPDKTVFFCDNCSRVFLKRSSYEAHQEDCNR